MPREIKARYVPQTTEQKLGYLVEEAGEVMERLGRVLAAAGKSQRWGLDSSNPELSPAKRKTNRQWLLEEMRGFEEELFDLGRAFEYIRTTRPEEEGK